MKGPRRPAPRGPDWIASATRGKSTRASSALALARLSAPSSAAIRALARSRVGDTRGALADCEAALATDPDSLKALGVRGYVKVLLRDYAGATADLDRVIERSPEDATALMNRGYAHAGRGDVKSALVDLERFLALAPSHVNAPTVRKYADELRAKEARR